MVAGLVALAAPAARIMPLRVLDSDGVGNVWVLAEALEYAMRNGAQVINLSLILPTDNHLLRDVLKAAACADAPPPGDLPCFRPDGAVVVEAAGNSATQTPPFPAGYSIRGSIVVGASEPSDSLAAFSNFGSWVTVEAPGDAIVSTVPDGGTGVWAGTSMAAPLVAGEVALVRSLMPSLATAEVVSRV